jgi:hypothetical protein
LQARRKPFQDSPTPAGNSAAALALLEPGFSPGFWKHNLGVALGFSKGMPSAFAGGPYDGMKCDATLIASKVTKLQATELYSTLCTGDGGVNAQARLDAANYLNALFGYSPYH